MRARDLLGWMGNGGAERDGAGEEEDGAGGQGDDAHCGLQLVVHASQLGFSWSIYPEQPLPFSKLLCDPGGPWGGGSQLCFAEWMWHHGAAVAVCASPVPAVVHPQGLLAGRVFSSSPLHLAQG